MTTPEVRDTLARAAQDATAELGAWASALRWQGVPTAAKDRLRLVVLTPWA